MTLRIKRSIAALFILITTHLLINCQSGNISGGLETTNGFITAHCTDGVISGSGKPESRLTLCEQSYIVQDTGNPVIKHCTINTAGNYAFDKVPSGSYNLFCWNDSKKQSIYISGITTANNGVLFDDTLWMTPSVTVSGTAHLGSNPKESIIISFVGSPLFGTTNAHGLYVINDVPEGNYDVYASLFVKSYSDQGYFEATTQIVITTDTAMVLPLLRLWRTQ